jgi:RimJ/RimL family protein N-acetyltransferase
LLNTRDIHIESHRISIRPFAENDADEAYRCITPSLTRYMSWEPPATRADFDNVWRGWLPAIADGSDFVFAIRQREEGDFLGLVGLHHVQTKNPELGIWIREDRHGEGFGVEAVALVATWATQTIGIERFVYPVAEANYSSRRIAESLGGVVIAKRTTPKYESLVYEIKGQTENS